jgi:RNA polymerase sigma-70 factor (ECF subfamily)
MKAADFDRLYDEIAPDLFSFLAYRTGDSHLAEDLVAETFERVFRARKKFDPRKASEKTWIYSIALNRLRDHTRRTATEGRTLIKVGSNQDAAPAELDAVYERDLVFRAMVDLSDEERHAISLRFGGDLTVPEIAKLMQEPLTTVEGRVYRALRKMRDALAP